MAMYRSGDKTVSFIWDGHQCNGMLTICFLPQSATTPCNERLQTICVCVCCSDNVGCCILLHIYPIGSLWFRQSQQSFNTSTRFYFPSLATCFNPYGPSSGEIRDRFSTENFLFLQLYVYNFYIYIQMITCIGNTKSRHRSTAGNISVSGRVRAADPLY
jgi:hypothetical protein